MNELNNIRKALKSAKVDQGNIKVGVEYNAFYEEKLEQAIQALITEQVRLGEKRGQLKGYNSGWVAGTRNVGVKKYAYFAKELEDAAKKLRNIEAQLKDTTKEDV